MPSPPCADANAPVRHALEIGIELPMETTVVVLLEQVQIPRSPLSRINAPLQNAQALKLVVTQCGVHSFFVAPKF
jgi:hypothetical protein